MTHTISVGLTPETFQQFEQIQTKLNAGDRSPQAKILGENFSKISCEIIDQAFGELIRKVDPNNPESLKVLGQIQDTIKKYMPWSVSFFGNERLIPLVNHIRGTMYVESEQPYVSFKVDTVIIDELLGCLERMHEGQNQYVAPGLKSFIKILDLGVTSLVREPKKQLKFNMVVDKTLNGVINVTSQLGFKRLENLSKTHDAKTIATYFDHFLNFLDQEGRQKANFTA